ncbi:hypothetical protein PORCRE_467 [Porphyromonas crevioricanis JCM 15906]|uniref:Uncharacterized protein n=1 Tax=Porphyromonas crevioricanis JCM 15906 TaxID=1305617 RepID=T1CGG4_9PORP|nr:hypothetical protein PORCRE_467 [Porphyromonas crevioricanis JCM 15906]
MGLSMINDKIQTFVPELGRCELLLTPLHRRKHRVAHLCGFFRCFGEVHQELLPSLSWFGEQRGGGFPSLFAFFPILYVFFT